MTHEAFIALLEDRIGKMRQTLAKKATEYASGSDRLHNFKEAAAFLRCSHAKACLAFLTKHLVSIVDVVEQGGTDASMIDEKVGDAINYLVLLEALLKERL